MSVTAEMRILVQMKTIIIMIKPHTSIQTDAATMFVVKKSISVQRDSSEVFVEKMLMLYLRTSDSKVSPLIFNPN